MNETKRRLRRFAALFATAAAGALVVGAHAASANVVEICKSSANGMAGRSFQFSITGGSTVTVTGGRCSGSITVAGSTVTITESPSNPATELAGTSVRPSIRKLGEDLAGRSVTVTTGTATTNETLVTFTNQPPGGAYGTLKVCKLTQTPAYIGKSFSFSVNGGALQSTEANDAFAAPSTWSCRILGTFQQGSNVRVHEAVPPGTEVASIDTDPTSALGLFSAATGDAAVTVGTGVTTVLYDDEPLPLSGAGWLEVCKDRAHLDDGSIDWNVQGAFAFHVVDASGAAYDLSVLAGQCSDPFPVAAGVAHVTEGSSASFDLVDAFTLPADRLLGSSLVNRTADVEVPASGVNDETQVHFVNKTEKGQLKVCKALGPGSSDLVGQRFYFAVTAAGVPQAGIWITAAAQTQCVIAGVFPIGATLDVEETGGPPDTTYIDTSGGGPVTIAPGINTVTITDTARGILEICKHVVFGVSTPPTFQFRVDGGSIVNVRAGFCTNGMRVSIGQHTVTELASANYELDPTAPNGGITVDPADRQVSVSLPARSVTVNVPYGTNGETLVTYFNRATQGQIKICKTITPGSTDALTGKPFFFDIWVLGIRYSVGPLVPGQCQFVSDLLGLPKNFPLTDAGGQQVVAGADEPGAYPVPPPVPSTYYVSNVTVSGSRGGIQTSCSAFAPSPTGKFCREFFPPPSTGPASVHITWNLGPGVNIVTFTNTAADP